MGKNHSHSLCRYSTAVDGYGCARLRQLRQRVIFANGAMSHRRSFSPGRSWIKGLRLSLVIIHWLQYFHDADEHSKASRVSDRYENGYGVEKNLKTAVQWYTKAMQRGDVTGTYYLGHMYEDGLGVAVDYTRAREMYEKASYRSDIISAPAQNALGRMYEKGEESRPIFRWPGSGMKRQVWQDMKKRRLLVRLGEPIRVTTRVMTQSWRVGVQILSTV